MDPDTSFQWFDDSDTIYAPPEVHTYVEISMKESEVHVTEVKVRDIDVPALCVRLAAEERSATWRLHLLLSDQVKQFVKIPYSHVSLQALKAYWHMSGAYLNMAGVAMASGFGTKSEGSAVEGFRFSTLDLCHATLALSHCPETRETWAIFYSASATGASDFQAALMSLKQHAHQPQLLPFIYTARHLKSVERYLYYQPSQDYYNIRTSLGCDFHFGEGEKRRDVDMTDMPRTLTSLTSVTAILDSVPGQLAQQLALIAELKSVFPFIEPGHCGNEMCLRLCFMKHRCAELSTRIQQMRESTQSMVQLVYARLQQTDNELNRRYAADMRVITAITLVFLPGTFVATLFSTSFWNFDPRSAGPLVSKWVWLYFFVTFALTFIVLCVWRSFTVVKRLIDAVKKVWREDGVGKVLGRRKRRDDGEVGEKGD